MTTTNSASRMIDPPHHHHHRRPIDKDHRQGACQQQQQPTQGATAKRQGEVRPFNNALTTTKKTLLLFLVVSMIVSSQPSASTVTMAWVQVLHQPVRSRTHVFQRSPKKRSCCSCDSFRATLSSWSSLYGEEQENNEKKEGSTHTDSTVAASRTTTTTTTNETAVVVQQQTAPLLLTSVLLQISFDGGRFTGWSAANDHHHHHGKKQQDPNNNSSDDKDHAACLDTTAAHGGGGGGVVEETDGVTTHPPGSSSSNGGKRRRRKSNRFLLGGSAGAAESSSSTGFVRSVQGVLIHNLAKLFGNVDPQRIVVEGCSRTDKGVHAKSMMAQIYCYKQTQTKEEQEHSNDKGTHDEDDKQPTDEHEHQQLVVLSSSSSQLQQERHYKNSSTTVVSPPPKPANATDSSHFVPLPKKQQSLHDLRYTLNRMLPPDVRVVRVAPIPTATTSTSTTFHPSLSTQSKTYQYSFSVGRYHDPTNWRTTWHVPSSSSSEAKAKYDDDTMDPLSSSDFLQRMQEAATVLTGRHNFAAFCGAPVSASDKRKRATQSTICTLHSITVQAAALENAAASYPVSLPWKQASTYHITIVGDRFLYKMVRFLVGAIVVGTAGGEKHITLQDLQEALTTGIRRDALQKVPCAPAHGLVLTHVQYNPEEFDIEWM